MNRSVLACMNTVVYGGSCCVCVCVCVCVSSVPLPNTPRSPPLFAELQSLNWEARDSNFSSPDLISSMYSAQSTEIKLNTLIKTFKSQILPHWSRTYSEWVQGPHLWFLLYFVPAKKMDAVTGCASPGGESSVPEWREKNTGQCWNTQESIQSHVSLHLDWLRSIHYCLTHQ